MSKVFIPFLLLTFIFSSQAFSADKGATPECKKIQQACKSAGYQRGSKEPNKGYNKDCMIPVMKGQKVAGLNITAAEVEACKLSNAKK